MPQSKKVYDLEERTAIFGEKIIDFLKHISKDTITSTIIHQLARSGTSIGSNYCEADCAESKKDFEHKIGICKKEAKESRYWLRILARAKPEYTDTARVLWQEAHELHLIFIAIVKKSKGKIDDQVTSSRVIRN